MASKWKYASLPASERIKMLESGSKDVFDEEVERTKEAVKARQELGLDTKAQEDWLDTVGYSYNLYGAKNMGISPENVSKTGYAEQYLGDSEKETSGGAGVRRSYKIAKIKASPGEYTTPEAKKIERASELAKAEIDRRYNEKRAQIEKEFYYANPNIREYVMNNGGHDDGGSMAKARIEIEKTFSEMLASLEKEREKEITASKKKYQGLIEQLIGYDKGGASSSSLKKIANFFVQKASREDGFDYNEAITGKSSGVKNKVNTDMSKKTTLDVSKFLTDSEHEDKKTLIPTVTKKNADDNASDDVATEFQETELDKDAEEEKVIVPDGEAVGKKFIDRISEITESARKGEFEKALSIIMKYSGLNKETAAELLKVLAEDFTI